MQSQSKSKVATYNNKLDFNNSNSDNKILIQDRKITKICLKSIKEVPKIIEDIQTLVELIIHNKGGLFLNLENLYNLETLEINSRSISPSLILKNENLSKITLYIYKMENFPDLTTLSTIQELNLILKGNVDNYGFLLQISLSKIQSLNIACYEGERFPLINFDGIKRLTFSNSVIGEFDFNQIPNTLEELMFTSCVIGEFINPFSDNENIESLALTRIIIDSNLQSFDLEDYNFNSDSKLSYIPDFLLCFKNLKTLDLIDNNISKTRSELCNLTLLEYVFLGSNPLTYIDDCLKSIVLP